MRLPDGFLRWGASRMIAVLLAGVAACCVAALSAAVVLGRVAVSPVADASQALPARVGSVPAAPAGATDIGSLSPTRVLHIDVALLPRNPAALARYATAVSTPGNRLFRDYLARGQFAGRFGPSAAAVAAVTNELKSDGLTPGAISANHLTIPVSATAAKLAKALSTGFVAYRLAGGTIAYANTRAPRFSAQAARYVQGVIGLDNLALPKPLAVRPVGAHRAMGASASPQVVTGGPQPCSTAVSEAAAAPGKGYTSYTADQIASAYRFSSLYEAGDEGAGITVALYEEEPNLTSDIAAYQSCYGTDATVNYIKVDGGAGSGAGEGEAALDIEDVIGLAPKATIDVYQAPNTDSGSIENWTAIVDNDSAQVVSTSWGFCERDASDAEISEEETLFEQAAVQGQSVFAAAGDEGSTDCGTASLAVDDPGSQPYVTSVGGTSLKTLGPPPSETVWNDSHEFDGAGGGGISSLHRMPSYQSGAPPSLNVINSHSSGSPCAAPSGSYCREVPDVSADADPYTGYLIYYEGSWVNNGGTSAAAPLWAAFTALTDASSACRGEPIGFANPVLYAAAASGYSSDFNDITSGNNDYTLDGYTGGLYPAGLGYDMASGLGTPNGASLPAALCKAAVSFTIEKLQRLHGESSYTKGQLIAEVGDTVEYKIIVTNNRETSLKFKALGDSNCEGVSPSGETALAAGESETFTCSHKLAGAGRYSNQASIEGNEGTGLKASNKVEVEAPAKPSFTIEELQALEGELGFTKAKLTGALGRTIDYEIIVKNTGNVPLKFKALSDANCTGVSPSTEETLAAGGEQIYTCQHELTGLGTYSNEASIEGTEGTGSKTSNRVEVEGPPSDAVAYVTDQGSNSVTPIELATGKVGGEIKVGSEPAGIAITPNGKTAYVVNSGSSSVTPIEVASNKVGPEIKVGSYPEAVAITPNGKTAYVTNLEGNSVTPIEVASNKAGPEIKVGSDPLGIAITPNGKTAYVANAGAAGAKSGSVTPIEVVSNKAGTEIKVGSEPYGVAVTPNGETAYVTNSGSNSVTPIEVASNKAGTEIKVGSEPDGIAITPNGKTAYVTNENANSGNSVTPIEVASNKAGAEIKVGEVPVGIAITPEGNTAYVTNLESKSVTPIEVASNKAGTEVKVGSEPDGIAIAPPNPPTVVTGAASELTPHSATLSATVDPNGKQVSACTFEYGTTTAYGKSAPCTPSPGSGENPVAVSAALTGLAPSSEYHYRISANNAGGRSKGSDATFKTLQSAPAVLTGAATAVTPGSATLDATVNPEGAEVSATNCKFEYGTSEAYGSSVNCEAAPGSGTSAVAVSAQITGLAADTTYYYRISATNAAGASKGSDATFKTLPNAPAVLTGGASSIAQTSATLNATVNPNGATVSQCKFEYGATTLYGNSVACSSSPGSGTSPVSVSAQITGLAANTIYYYRVSATNEGGTGEGLGEQLKTLPNAPVVMTGAATALTQGAATLNATVNPEGGEVSAANCKFEYGTSEAYGSSVSCEKAPGSGTSAVAVSAQIAGLTADTTYYYRVSATNEGGTSEGLGEQLKTLPDAPAVLTGGASSITQSSVTLSATVNPNGAIVSQCNFEYGATAGYGKSEPCTSSPGAGTSPVAVSASLTGLAANTTYHFRVSATNAGGTSKGSDETFTTPAAAEYGTCGKTSKVDKRYTSKYEDKNCTTANAKSEGEYEWVPTPEHSQIKTTDKTKTATLKSGHVSVVCKKSTSEGEITGPTTDTETVTYTDCAAAGKACTSAGASAGSIKTSLLDTSLVAEHGEVWTRYESSSPPYLDQFECAGIKYGVKGSVAAVDGCNVNVMATKDCETFAEGKGEQHLELEVLGGASEPAAELTTDTSKIATKVEIKTSS